MDYEDVEFDGDMAFVDGEPFSGVIFSTYSNGQPETECQYRDGLPDGLQQAWYPNGQIERRAMARWGNGSSKSEYWHANGARKSVRFNDESNRPVSIAEWDEQGSLINQKNWPKE